MTRRAILLAATAALTLATPASANTKLSSTPFQTHHQWQTNWDNLVQRGTDAGLQWQCNGALCDMSFMVKPGVKAKLSTREHGRGYCYIVDGDGTADCYREDGKKTVWTEPHDDAAPQIASAPVPDSTQYVPATPAPAPSALSADAIPMQCSLARGGCHLRVDLGDSNAADMILDTGTTDMSVTWQWATALVNEGAAIWGNPVQVTLADNSTQTQNTVIIKRVSVGNRVAYNVIAGVKESGDLLLGLAPLNDMGKFTIDARSGYLNFAA